MVSASVLCECRNPFLLYAYIGTFSFALETLQSHMHLRPTHTSGQPNIQSMIVIGPLHHDTSRILVLGFTPLPMLRHRICPRVGGAAQRLLP